jgi:hypothetical protein
LKTHAARGERIEIRRLHDRMAVTAERAGRLVVGEKEHDVRPDRGFGFPRPRGCSGLGFRPSAGCPGPRAYPQAGTIRAGIRWRLRWQTASLRRQSGQSCRRIKWCKSGVGRGDSAGAPSGRGGLVRIHDRTSKGRTSASDGGTGRTQGGQAVARGNRPVDAFPVRRQRKRRFPRPPSRTAAAVAVGRRAALESESRNRHESHSGRDLGRSHFLHAGRGSDRCPRDAARATAIARQVLVGSPRRLQRHRTLETAAARLGQRGVGQRPLAMGHQRPAVVLAVDPAAPAGGRWRPGLCHLGVPRRCLRTGRRHGSNVTRIPRDMCGRRNRAQPTDPGRTRS